MEVQNGENKVLARINDAMSNRQMKPAKAVAGETTYSFQHLTIERFKVGPFQFHDGIVKVPESRVDAFIALWEGLHASDKNQIVQLKEEVNTRTLRDFKAVRGAIGTADIKAPIKDTPAPAANESPAATDAAQASNPNGGFKLPSFTPKTT